MNQSLANLTFILGGARSGKSSLAEQRAMEYGSSVIYCATAEVLDDEMEKRVAIHRSRRPEGWRTVEAPSGAAQKLKDELTGRNADCVLFDCLSILTSNVLLTLDENVSESEAFSVLRSRELDALLAAGLPESATSMQAIGYKELLRERRGEITREQAFDDIKRGSRNYAKRQLTWLRRNPEVHWISLGAEPDFEEVYRRAAAILAEAGFPGAEAIFSAPT